MAEFVCVDPEQVETNLVHNAKVVLNHIEIKARCFGGGCFVLSGSVLQIEFSWAWDKATLITDVRLAAKGVTIHVNIVEKSHGQHIRTKAVSPASFNAPDATEGGVDEIEVAPNWKAKYLQQIIDHLTLEVTDATIAIHFNGDSQVILRAKAMELQTLQTDNEEATTLLQTIRFTTIEALLQKNDPSPGHYPILEPFAYNASVKRTSGRRFLDGLMSGLFVQGESAVDFSNECSSTIRIHAGIQQISGLSRLWKTLLSLGLQVAAVTDENMDLIANSLNDTRENKATISSDATDIKSVFHLPFQCMEVVLENETKVRLEGCTIRYCTDGTELSVDCCGGIWVEDVPFSEHNRWILDLVSSELVLDSLQFLRLSQQEIDGETFYNAHSSMGSEREPEAELDESVDNLFRLQLTSDML